MIVAVSRTKNERDIVEASMTRMLAQVDHVIVGDGSTDETTEILRSLPLTLIDDTEPTFRQPEQMNALARMAGDMGADWIVPFDCDEIWLADEGTLKDRLAGLPDEVLIAEARLFNHVVTAKDDSADPDPISRIGWRSREPIDLPKVACRWRDDLTIHFGQHGATYTTRPGVARVLQARHFPYRSHRQFIEKIRVGAPPLIASDLPEHFGAHWRGFGETLERGGEQALIDWFDRWAYSADPENDPELIFDPCPPYSSPSPESVLTAEQP